MFRDRARAQRPDLDADPGLVVDICRRLSGVPLALELAAARARHLPLALLRDRLRFVRLLAEVDQNMGRENEWFELLAAEEANVRASLMWAAEDADADALLRLSIGMWQFWLARGVLTEGRRWLESGLSLLPPAAAETRMDALWGARWPAYHQADDVTAEESAKERGRLARRDRDVRALRNADTIRGMVAISREDATGAVRLLEEALRIARSLGRGWTLATSLLNLGLGCLSAGATERARTLIGEALTAYQDIGDERFHARCVGYLGLVSLSEDDPDRARVLFAQSLGVFGFSRSREGTAEGLAGVAAADAATGHLARAATLAGAAERLRESYAGRELPLHRRTTGRYLASAESRLGSGAWAEACAQGRDLPLDEAIGLALTSPG